MAVDSAPTTREIVFPVEKWGGMASSIPVRSVPIDSWSYLLNMDFRNPLEVQTRMGTTLFIDHGSSVQILDGYEFKRTTDTTSKIVYATSDGKLWQVNPTSGSTPSLIGNLTNPTPTIVTMSMMKDALYITDGVSALKWDGTTLTDIKSTFPSVVPSFGNILCGLATKDRMWYIDDNDWICGSVPNLPDNLTDTSSGAYKVQVSYSDGMKATSLVRWGNTFLINKSDNVTGQYAIYWVRGIGSTSDPFRIEAMFGDSRNPTAFLGKSAVQIGSDVIGLTNIGVTTISAINNFQEANADPISAPIDDLIQRVNLTAAHKIVGAYDTFNKQYMCAVPLDGATSVSHVLVYDKKYDRWSHYDNWTVRSWIRVGTNLLYGNETGKLIKTRDGHSDLGSAFNKIAEGGSLGFNMPEVTKMFKSVDVSITHNGDYSIDFLPIIDDLEVGETTSIRLDDESALWDEFKWDQDKYDLSGDSARTILILGRGKRLRVRFLNSNINEPFSIGSLSYRMVAKATGTPKN